jgi:GT2 family glycosyltransferase
VKILFICVNYNNGRFTCDFLESIKNQCYLQDGISVSAIVVDNSIPGDVILKNAELEKKFPFANYIFTNNNFGYFNGLNFGISHINPNDFKFIIVCNNDLILESNFISNLLNNNYNENIYAICPMVTDLSGKNQNPHLLNRSSFLRILKFDLFFMNYYVGCLMHLTSNLFRFKKHNASMVVAQCIEMGVGAIYVLTNNFFVKNANLNFPHFLFGEEVYFSHQVHSTGGLLLYDPTLLVMHREHSSVNNLPKKFAYMHARISYWASRKLL